MMIPTFNVFKMSLYKWGGYSNNKQFVDRRLVAAPENTDDTVEKSAVGIVDRREDRRDDDYGQDIRDIEYNAEEIRL